MSLEKHECTRCKKAEVSSVIDTNWLDVYEGTSYREMCRPCALAWQKSENMRNVAPVHGYEGIGNDAPQTPCATPPCDPDPTDDVRFKIARAVCVLLFAGMTLLGFFAEVAFTSRVCASLGFVKDGAVLMQLATFAIYAAGVGFVAKELLE